MASYGRGGDVVYRDPAPLGTRLIMAGLVLLIMGSIATLATRCRRSGGSSAPICNPARIACVGDSITYGYGLSDREEQCWTFLLQALLPEGTVTANYGVSGSCAMSSSSYAWAHTAQAQLFRSSEEDLVLVMLGTNDVASGAWDAGAFERQYAELVAEIQAKPGNPRVVVMLPPKIYGSPTMDGRLRDDAIPAMRRVAQDAGCDIVDLYALTDNHPTWFDDGLHPNAEANEAIAQEVARCLCGQDSGP